METNYIHTESMLLSSTSTGCILSYIFSSFRAFIQPKSYQKRSFFQLYSAKNYFICQEALHWHVAKAFEQAFQHHHIKDDE